MRRACRGRVVLRWKLFDELDIGYEPGACEGAFEQIVTEERILRHACLERLLKRFDLVKTLAGVTAFAEEILINV